MFHSKIETEMKQDLIDLVKVGIVNTTAFVTTNVINIELLLKYTLYIVSIVYTIFKIIKMIADRLEHQKKLKKED